MNLLTMQRDLRCWLTREPAALPASFTEADRDGLSVYLNNYRSQLIACLSASFPAVLALLGEDAFRAAAAHCMDERPPRSWTLDDYAEEFPQALAEWLVDAPHVFELARLELALATVFVDEDAEVLDARQLGAVDWDAAVLRLAPAFALMKVTTNAAALWSAIDAGLPPPAASILREPEHLVLWRTKFTCSFRTVTPAEASALAQVRDGTPFGEICQALIHTLGAEPGTAAAGAMLGRWLADGLIVGIAD